jgi:hypothetical protein
VEGTYKDDWQGREMRRLLLSIAGGVLIPILIFGGALLGALVAHLWHITWLGESFLWLIGWPLALLKPLTPSSEDTSSTAAHIRLAVYLATPILDFLAYSLLTYTVLWWRAKQKRFS